MDHLTVQSVLEDGSMQGRQGCFRWAACAAWTVGVTS